MFKFLSRCNGFQKIFLIVTITILIVASAIELAYAGQAYSPKDTKNYIPPQAFDHRETIKSELDRLWPSIPEYNYVPSLIEHESCISLQHSRCWNSESQLKSAREIGLGLGQYCEIGVGLGQILGVCRGCSYQLKRAAF